MMLTCFIFFLLIGSSDLSTVFIGNSHPIQTINDGQTLVQVKEIKGGLGISVLIENTATTDVENIQWSIIVEGFVPIGNKRIGTIPHIAKESTVTIRSHPIIGLGPVTISILLDGAPTRAKATLFGPFVTKPQMLHPDDPPIIHFESIAPIKKDVLAIRIDTGEFTGGMQRPYVAEPEDMILTWGKDRWVSRNDEIIGALVGKEGDIIYSFDELTGVYKRDYLPVDPQEIQIEKLDNPMDPFHPLHLSKKTRPSNYARINAWEFAASLTHILYLQFPTDLQIGTTYRIHFADEYLGSVEYTHQPRHIASEAVHVSQIGFRPDDPVRLH